MKGSRAAAAVALALAWPGPAEAKPTLWQRAAEPSRSRADKALRRLERNLDEVALAEGEPETIHEFRRGALLMAELSNATALGDPRLQLLLARLNVEVGREERAQAIVSRVLGALEPGSTWLEAEARVVLAAALQTSPAAAVGAVTRALPLVWAGYARSVLLRQRANAKMALLDVRGSARDHRAALAAAEGPLQQALARYGIGLALERAGELPAAMIELRLAEATAPKLSGSDLRVLDVPSLFSFRPFDAHYVSALASMARARVALEPEDASLAYDQALVDWERFALAAPSDDPFVPSARLHQAACERARRELPEAAGPERPPAP